MFRPKVLSCIPPSISEKMSFITNLNSADLLIIIIYIFGITWWGLRNAKNETSNDYFLAGRNMTWIVVGLPKAGLFALLPTPFKTAPNLQF